MLYIYIYKCSFPLGSVEEQISIAHHSQVFWWVQPLSRGTLGKCRDHSSGIKNSIDFGLSPFPVIVTTRIITFFVGDPYKPSFATITGKGDNPR